MRHHFFSRAQHCRDHGAHGEHGNHGFEFGGRRHGHGFGPFAGGFMGGMGMGGQGFRSGRKLGSNELQIVLLALLALQPSHGYELIKALEERSGGFYSPSPGMIYPALTYLEEVGYASVVAEGARKLYSITAEGREHLQKNQQTAQTILDQLEHIGARMGRVRDIFSGDGDGETEDEGAGAPADVWMALRELKLALRGKRHAGVKEARRVAAILKRAVAEILGED